MKPLFTYPFAKPSLVHHLLFIVLCCLFLFLQACSEPNATSKHTKDSEVLVQAPTALKVREGFVNPIGYYENKPRFSWQISAQSATHDKLRIKFRSHRAPTSPNLHYCGTHKKQCLSKMLGFAIKAISYNLGKSILARAYLGSRPASFSLEQSQ